MRFEKTVYIGHEVIQCFIDKPGGSSLPPEKTLMLLVFVSKQVTLEFDT